MLRPSILCTLDLIHSDFVLSLSLSLDLPLAAEYFKLAGGESNIGYTLDRKGSAHRYLTLAPTNKNILRVRTQVESGGGRDVDDYERWSPK